MLFWPLVRHSDVICNIVSWNLVQISIIGGAKYTIGATLVKYDDVKYDVRSIDFLMSIFVDLAYLNLPLVRKVELMTF